MKTGGGPRFRPKHPASPETRARWNAEQAAGKAYTEARERAFDVLGGRDNAVEIGGEHKDLAEALGMPLVRYERSSDFSWYVRHEDKYLIGAIDYTYPDYSCMRVEKLAARLSKHLPAIRAAIALGTPANAVSLMIREAIRR